MSWREWNSRLESQKPVRAGQQNNNSQIQTAHELGALPNSSETSQTPESFQRLFLEALQNKYTRPQKSIGGHELHNSTFSTEFRKLMYDVLISIKF